MPGAEILQHASLSLAMPVLPEDRNFVLLAGDGYVAGTALALILFPEPKIAPKKVKGRRRKHELDQAKTALRIKLIAALLAVLLAAFWALGHFGAFDSAEYHALPSDHSLFAAIPLFGIADLIAATQAFGLTKLRRQSFTHQRELGDTTGQLYSIALVSVYLGFWLATFASSR
jgi:hypothetical protein